MESDLTLVHCSTAPLGFFSSSNEELLSDDDDSSAPGTQSDGRVVYRMVANVIKIVLFNYKTTVAGRVTFLQPTVITNKITLLSRVISVAATVISSLARIFRGIDSAHLEYNSCYY